MMPVLSLTQGKQGGCGNIRDFLNVLKIGFNKTSRKHKIITFLTPSLIFQSGGNASKCVV